MPDEALNAPAVRVSREGAVAVLTLNDPARRNAMTPALGDALRDAVASLRDDASVRAVVLTGAGAAFSSRSSPRRSPRSAPTSSQRSTPPSTASRSSA